jgi:branched-chain amino acid aminotransferase
MNKIDWKNLSFGYQKTNYNVRCHFKNSKWGELEICSSETIDIHMAATGLHYGQEAFEGLKAFKGPDEKVRLFRWQDNAQRMINSARGVLMAEVPKELFFEAVKKAIQLNAEFVPPYESGASLYIRPLLFGSGPRIGVKPADEYMFVVFVTPVGPYFKEGFKPVSMLITREYDRAAPLGTGKFKVGGNYAASLKSMQKAHEGGYANVLYLDAREKKYIDECGPANFFAIKDNSYITPKSESILPSITNKSLMQLAKDIGMEVQERKVAVEELANFEEVGACGTAAVISPINKIVDEDIDIVYSFGGDEPGKISSLLYHKLQGIQYGTVEDIHGWTTIIDL